MILNRRAALFSALIGFLVGFVWEGFGAVYLWVLSAPQLLIFGLAMIVWPILGLIMATVLRIIEAIAPKYKVFLKPLAGPSALITARIMNSVGVIASYRFTGPGFIGAPLYMMTGWLVLIYLLDFLSWRRKA
ncbi:MAG: hypothetical protein ACE5PV_01335 [Candidatus Poribacteria bacterium]